MEAKEHWTAAAGPPGPAVAADPPDNGLPPADGGSSSSTNNNEDKCNRNLRLLQDVQGFISDKGRQKIQGILDQVQSLVPTEKLLLYLQLPTENPATVDPLRQSINPLGSRSEINQTINWIQTHLEEDRELSLQKKGVYDDYLRFCERNSIKPLSTADFGKVMKQVYPNVRPRRLGTRGQSKYCYSGLRNRVKLNAPLLPDLSEKPMSTEENFSQSDLMAAAWIIIKEWAEGNLSKQFKSLFALAHHLITDLSIGLGSEAANMILGSPNVNVKDEPFLPFGNFNRHRETTLQLQRKLQQKSEVGKETKRKQLQSPRMEQRTRGGKKARAAASRGASPTSAAQTPKGSPQSQEHSPVCDSNSLHSLPDFGRFQQPADKEIVMPPLVPQALPQPIPTDYAVGKVAIPRITSNAVKHAVPLSPKRAKTNKYKVIQPKLEPCDRAPPGQACTPDPRSQLDMVRKQARPRKKESPSLITAEETKTLFSRERLISIGQVSKNALDEYLGSNSQEPEEEIMQYFGGNNNDDQDTTKKISQLRQLLEKNQLAMDVSVASSEVMAKRAQKAAIALPNLQNLSAKRRVSFEDPVPASPNTRRANINFIPISVSPNGQSKCSSTTASPFVSPRNTPIPRSRGNSHPYIARSTQQPFKLKHEKLKKPDLEITIPEEKDYYKPQQGTMLAMSAPPSPKTNYFFNKHVSGFQQTQGLGICESLSPEVGQLFTTTSNAINPIESALRSQSVPVNQFFDQYGNFSSEALNIDFNNENLNVNLDLLNMPTNEFEPGPSLPLEESLTLPIEPEDVYQNKLPSRSVPSTPLPYSHLNALVTKSYPSTPLTAETFTYNLNQDYLLNGQPIKEKFAEPEESKGMFFPEGDLYDGVGSFVDPESKAAEGVDEFFKVGKQ